MDSVGITALVVCLVALVIIIAVVLAFVIYKRRQRTAVRRRGLWRGVTVTVGEGHSKKREDTVEEVHVKRLTQQPREYGGDITLSVDGKANPPPRDGNGIHAVVILPPIPPMEPPL